MRPAALPRLVDEARVDLRRRLADWYYPCAAGARPHGLTAEESAALALLVAELFPTSQHARGS